MGKGTGGTFLSGFLSWTLGFLYNFSSCIHVLTRQAQEPSMKSGTVDGSVLHLDKSKSKVRWQWTLNSRKEWFTDGACTSHVPNIVRPGSLAGAITHRSTVASSYPAEREQRHQVSSDGYKTAAWSRWDFENDLTLWPKIWLNGGILWNLTQLERLGVKQLEWVNFVQMCRKMGQKALCCYWCANEYLTTSSQKNKILKGSKNVLIYVVLFSFYFHVNYPMMADFRF